MCSRSFGFAGLGRVLIALRKIGLLLLHLRKFTELMFFAGANDHEGNAGEKSDTPRKSHNTQAQ